MSVVLPSVGTAGRTCRFARDRAPEPPLRSGDTSSYCLMCASWYFSENIPRCVKCGSDIYLWLRNSDLHLMRGRSTLGRL